MNENAEKRANNIYIFRDDEGKDPIEYTQSVDLFSTDDFIGMQKMVSVDYDRNMLVTAVYVLDNGNEEPFAQFKLDSIDHMLKKDMFEMEDATRPTINMVFTLNRSGLVQLSDAIFETYQYELITITRKKTQEEKDEEDRKWAEDVAIAQAWAAEQAALNPPEPEQEEEPKKEDEEFIAKLEVLNE